MSPRNTRIKLFATWVNNLGLVLLFAALVRLVLLEDGGLTFVVISGLAAFGLHMLARYILSYLE